MQMNIASIKASASVNKKQHKMSTSKIPTLYSSDNRSGFHRSNKWKVRAISSCILLLIMAAFSRSYIDAREVRCFFAEGIYSMLANLVWMITAPSVVTVPLAILIIGRTEILWRFTQPEDLRKPWNKRYKTIPIRVLIATIIVNAGLSFFITAPMARLMHFDWEPFAPKEETELGPPWWGPGPYTQQQLMN